jgi:FkbM family methyltransferase
MIGDASTTPMSNEISRLNTEIEKLRSVTYEHHWRLQTLEAAMRKRVVTSDARAALLELGRVPRAPGCVSRSQYGEDAIIWDILGGQTNGRFVEAGAIDGLALSVTAILESVGWSGLLVEPIPEQAEACRHNRPASTVVGAALGAPGHASSTEFVHVEGTPEFSGIAPDETHRKLARDQGGKERRITVPMCTLDDALERSGAGTWDAIDAVILDLEGGELDALRGFSLERWRPRLLMIEDHDRSDASPIAAFMRATPYTLVGTVRINRVYVQRDEVEMLARAQGVHWL